MRTLITIVSMIVCADSYAAEPMPQWDLKRAALAELNDYMGLALRHLNDQNLLPADRADFEAVVQRGPEFLFNRYLAWEKNAQNTLAVHWAEYSDYKVLQCTDLVQQSPNMPPSYVSLEMCITPDHVDERPN